MFNWLRLNKNEFFPLGSFSPSQNVILKAPMYDTSKLQNGVPFSQCNRWVTFLSGIFEFVWLQRKYTVDMSFDEKEMERLTNLLVTPNFSLGRILRMSQPWHRYPCAHVYVVCTPPGITHYAFHIPYPTWPVQSVFTCPVWFQRETDMPQC